MKDLRIFDVSDFVMDEDFIRWVYKKRKIDSDFWNNWMNRNSGKSIVVMEAFQILELIKTEQKMISEGEKRREIKRLMQAIGGQES